MTEQLVHKPALSDLNRPAATDSEQSGRSLVLKACIFATGLAGIVAEYVLATLATYLLGNAVLQWTLVLSLMLFAMGIGSRLSKSIRGPLFDVFVGVEFTLSFLCALSAVSAYFLSAYIAHMAPVIYGLALGIGVLIGLEIPLATRMNNVFEELRVNISSVMENDYFGALLGGLLFAFVALPYLGLTYTPILLGVINFSVAAVLFLKYRNLFKFRRFLVLGLVAVPVALGALAIMAKPIVLYGEQSKYRDRIVFQKQTPYQLVVVTQWKSHYWLYINGNEQFSSYDEERYHEPLVHPAMGLSVARQNVLVLGGGDGLALRELLKYPETRKITLVDIDPAMTELGQTHPIFRELNHSAFDDPRVQVVNQDAYTYLKSSDRLFDVIVIDLPDPGSVDLARLYSRQFYRLVGRHLSRGGVVVTQATSPFFAPRAFQSIFKTMDAAGFPAIAFHTHIPTLGEWGWVLGMNAKKVTGHDLKTGLKNLTFQGLGTRYLNQESMGAMLAFGKGFWDQLNEIEVNDELDLAVYHYYRKGSWDLY